MGPQFNGYVGDGFGEYADYSFKGGMKNVEVYDVALEMDKVAERAGAFASKEAKRSNVRLADGPVGIVKEPKPCNNPNPTAVSPECEEFGKMVCRLKNTSAPRD